MKILQSGYGFKIYDDGLIIHNQLPADAYSVSFSQMSGWSLNKYSDIEIKEKIYGVHQQKVDKVMNAFKAFNRNLGVILSGDKGIGKSLFSKLLAKTAIEQGYPLIIVDNYIPGIASFLSSIEQEVVVLFDEFDKTFSNQRASSNEGAAAQAEMLTLFDGIAQGKKLFIVTCNEIRNINGFLVNRPGRFHYHFRFEYPTEEEIRDYMKDKLNPEYYAEIDKVVNFARKIDLNYDCLRSIAFEINQCGDFDNAISDLNILRQFGEEYQVVTVLSNGEKLINNMTIDFWDTENVVYYAEDDYSQDIFLIEFSTTDAIWSNQHHNYVVPKESLKVELDEDLKDGESYPPTSPVRQKWEKYSKLDVDFIILNKKISRKMHYYGISCAY